MIYGCLSLHFIKKLQENSSIITLSTAFGKGVKYKKDIAGKLRQHQVAIPGSRFMPPFPVETYTLLTDFFRWYGRNKDHIHPAELAALVHLKLVTIHPFADGNGRISRLIMNFVLRRYRFPMLNIPYEKRSGYYMPWRSRR